MRYLLEQPPDTEAPVLFSSWGSDQKIQCRNERSWCPRNGSPRRGPQPALPTPRAPIEGGITFLASKAKEERSTSGTRTKIRAPSSPCVCVASQVRHGPARSGPSPAPAPSTHSPTGPQDHGLQPTYTKMRKEKSVSVVKHVGNKIKTSQ